MLSLPQITTGPIDTTPSGTRVYDANPWQGGNIGEGANFVTSAPINSYSVLSIPAYWRAMNFLATNLASFPRSVHKDGARRNPDEAAHPLERLLRRQPNSCQNATIFWRTLFFHAAHTANGYAEIVRSPAEIPTALRNLMPEDVLPFRYDSGGEYGAHQYYLIRSTRRIIRAVDVIHIQALGYDGMIGTDCTQLHAETFKQASTLSRYQTKFLQKGTVIRGAIQIPLGVSDEQTKQIVETLRQFFRGPDAERDVIVLSDGATLNNATLSPQQSQLVEQGALVTKQIAQLTGVPPQFLYEFSESKYNNSIEQMGQDVVRYTFRPWIEQAEDELTTKLLSNDDQDAGFQIQINPDALLRGDTAAVNTSAISTVNGGLRTRNEGRALLGLPPDTDAESDKLKTLGDTSPGGNGAKNLPAPATDDGDSSKTASRTASERLSQWHVEAAMSIIERLKAGTVGPIAAKRLIMSVGLDAESAEQMVAEVSGSAAAVPPETAFAAMHPILAEACSRVDRKTDRAFENASGKTGQERTIHFNVFAEQQRGYVVDALTPPAVAMKALGTLIPPDVEKIADRYAAAIRHRAASGEATALINLVTSPAKDS